MILKKFVHSLRSNSRYYRNRFDAGEPATLGDWYVAPWQGYYFPNGYYGGEADLGDIKMGAHNINTNDQIVGLLGSKISLVKNLDVVLEYSQVRNFDKLDQFAPYRVTYSYYNDKYGVNRSMIKLQSGESFQENGTATATYKFNVSKNSKFKVLGGTSFEDLTTKTFGTSRMDLLNNFQPELNLGSASTMSNWSSAGDYALASFFGRVNYNFADRYLFEFNVRADGSSRFSKGRQWGTFPSASFGWRISKEKFMKNVSNLDNLKLRLSYGQLGNQNIDWYASRDILAASNAYPINDQLETTVQISSLANKDISWETTTMANIGVDLNVFKQFSLSYDYYKKVSSNILYRVAIPTTTGVGAGPYENVAEVQNVGWDLTMGWNKKFKSEFQLGAKLNVSHYVNEIKKLNKSTSIVFPSSAYNAETSSYLYVWQVGKPIDSFYGYQVGGVATQEQIDKGLIPQQNFNIEAGDLWYKDVAGNDNKITDADRGIIGDAHPDLIYSLNLTANWKGFDFSLLLEGVQGMKELLYGEMYRIDFNTQAVNKPKYFLNRWTEENPSTTFPKIRFLTDKVTMSDFYVENASYLRGKDLTIGYTLPKATINSIGIRNVRVYANCRDLFLLTKFRGVDPETTNYKDTSKAGNVPPSKVFTLGVQVQL